MWYFTIFLTNATILIFEIAGAHLLAPYLGTSGEVWAGTIAVILGGMAIGYWIAGIVADQRSSRPVLSLLVFASGLAALVTWSVRDIVPTLLSSSFALPLTFTAMGTAALLFLPTTILLAAVSPFVAKALILTLDSSGQVVGRVNAVGTLGSITGAVLTSTIILPVLGIGTVFLSLALLLMAWALVLSTDRIITKMTVGVLAIGFGLLIAQTPTQSDYTIADISTPYNRIWVTEQEYKGNSYRMLKTDPFGIQCAMPLLSDGTVDETHVSFDYMRGFEAIARVTAKEQANALFLGGCNYSHPRVFLTARPDAHAMVVEIDPGMTNVAQQYFDFVPEEYPSLLITHMDARRFLVEHTSVYDLVFMDVFNSSSDTPYHLTTQEMFALLETHVSPDGVVVVNLISSLQGEGAGLASSLLATARTAFPHVALYTLGNTPLSLPQSTILVAGNHPLPDSYGLTKIDGVHLSRVDETHLPSPVILTDNYAPVEYLTRKIREMSF